MAQEALDTADSVAVDTLAAQAAIVGAEAAQDAAELAQAAAEAAQVAAEAAQATSPAYDSTVGEALNYVRLNAGETAMEFRTPGEVLGDIGAQAYDADTAKTDVAQTFTISQKGTQTTDDDLSFNLATTNFFKCTPSAGGALTFTNIPTGQSGMVLLVNGSNYAITAAATTKVGATTLATISATGTYLLSYYADGTNVFVVNSGALA
jgi:hypothetical protein